MSPHRLILKTCGTTLNLLGLPRILDIAANEAGLCYVHRCFYSRKSFMFPERQLDPHRDWKQEVEYLDNIFPNGAAYTVGKVNGDHWLLYMTNPECLSDLSSGPTTYRLYTSEQEQYPDYTIEILMSNLSSAARQPFFSTPLGDEDPLSSSNHAQCLSEQLGIANIFPPHLTTLDAYAFSPCGYSSNALIKWGDDTVPGNYSPSVIPYSGEGYFTIHVTPEEGWSYASFECNIPLSTSTSSSGEEKIPDLTSLVRRVVSIFQPGRLSLTLFISCKDNETDPGDNAIEAAQKAFKTALTEPFKISPIPDQKLVYKRTEKINYGFGGYDLAFASFELK